MGTWQTFNDGDYLLAADVDNLQKQGVIEVSDSTELNALSTSVKAAWMSGWLWRRDFSNTWYQVEGTSVNRGGDTMTGGLGVPLPTLGTHATSKNYVDGLVAGGQSIRVGRSGPYPIGADASTGNIGIAHTLGTTPTAVFVSADSDGGDCTVFASVETFNSSTLTAQMRNIGGAETDVYVNWLVIG